VGLESDRGGGVLLLPDVSDNLHGFWDGRIGPDLVHDAPNADSDDALVRALASASAPAPFAFDEEEDFSARVIRWASETLVAARHAYPDTLRIVSYNPQGNRDFYKVEWEGKTAYQQRCAPIVSERMTSAANNLAGLLDAIWP
jgi:hypothetical protein